VKHLTNDTPFEAGWTTAFASDGRELIVVVVKGTFVLAHGEGPNATPLAEQQMTLLTADVFGKEAATSAPIAENDYAPRKSECDVLLAGSAHAPFAKPVRRLDVVMEVGSVHKSFAVTGKRAWVPGFTGGVVPGASDVMVSQPITYEWAFGGTEVDPHDPGRVETFLDNPVGRGFRKRNMNLSGELMPVTEDPRDPIRDPRKAYHPMSFGPLGRNWRPRAQYVGTYDQNWIENVAPMLPPDFDARYFQAAPIDQRMAYPRGGERIRLVNLVPPLLSPNASVEARVPRVPLAMVFVPGRQAPVAIDPKLDTIVIQPNENQFTCTWRSTYITNRDTFEIDEVVVFERGRRSEAKLRARLLGKEYFQGLNELARWRTGEPR